MTRGRANHLPSINHAIWAMLYDPWPVTYGLGHVTHLASLANLDMTYALSCNSPNHNRVILQILIWHTRYLATLQIVSALSSKLWHDIRVILQHQIIRALSCKSWHDIRVISQLSTLQIISALSCKSLHDKRVILQLSKALSCKSWHDIRGILQLSKS